MRNYHLCKAEDIKKIIYIIIFAKRRLGDIGRGDKSGSKISLGVLFSYNNFIEI